MESQNRITSIKEAKGFYCEDIEDYFEDSEKEELVYTNIILLNNDSNIPKTIRIKADFNNTGEFRAFCNIFLYPNGTIGGSITSHEDDTTVKYIVYGKHYLVKTNLLLAIKEKLDDIEKWSYIVSIPLTKSIIINYSESFKITKIEKGQKVKQDVKPKPPTLEKLKGNLFVFQKFNLEKSKYLSAKLIVSGELLRCGWEISITSKENIIIINRGDESHVLLFHLPSKINTWKIKRNEWTNKVVHSFIGFPKDTAEAYIIYNIDGSVIERWLKQSGTNELVLTKKNKSFSKYEDYWNYFY